jgi:hypothetical protein
MIISNGCKIIKIIKKSKNLVSIKSCWDKSIGDVSKTLARMFQILYTVCQSGGKMTIFKVFHDSVRL